MTASRDSPRVLGVLGLLHHQMQQLAVLSYIIVHFQLDVPVVVFISVLHVAGSISLYNIVHHLSFHFHLQFPVSDPRPTPLVFSEAVPLRSSV